MQTSSNTSQHARAIAFKALHERPGLFLIPNPWDAGSASLLTSLGFEALTTTSAGLAYTLGRPDGKATREQTLENAGTIIAATTLPVAADLENGYGDDPVVCARTITLAAEAGLVGASIEDFTGREEDPIYPFAAAVERVRAAVQAARGLPFPFQLTARAENLIHDRLDLKDTIRRLEAFAEAGADVLYAPGLRTKEEVDSVVRAVAPKPVNVLMALSGVTLTLDDLEALGVRRVSIGSYLARVAYGAFYQAAEEMRRVGSFSGAATTISYARMNELLKS